MTVTVYGRDAIEADHICDYLEVFGEVDFEDFYDVGGREVWKWVFADTDTDAEKLRSRSSSNNV